SSGWPDDADDRPRVVGRVLPQRRLVDGLGRGRLDGRANPDSAGRVQPLPDPRRGAGERHVNSRFGRTWLAFGYAFLYIPIATLIVFSFNESKMVTLWSGFSLRWYHEILHDSEFIDAFLTSLKIALMTATASIVLGTMAAFALVRYRSSAKAAIVPSTIEAERWPLSRWCATAALRAAPSSS